MKQEKVKVSRKQFAEQLYYFWLAPNLTTEAVKETAKDLGFEIRNNEDRNKIGWELFILNMWVIGYTWAGVVVRQNLTRVAFFENQVRQGKQFEDFDKMKECLDILDHLAYDDFVVEKEKKGFDDWMKVVALVGLEYNKAMGTEHPSTPLWVVANVFNKRLFGEVRKDVGFQLKLITRIGLSMKYLAEAIKQYDIE